MSRAVSYVRFMETSNTTTITDIAAACVKLLDGSGDYDARTWAKHGHVRVYVNTTCRKRKECGWFGLAPDGTPDFSGLNRQKGTISGLVADEIERLAKLLPEPTPRQERRRACDECGYHGGHRMDCALLA